MSNRVVSPVTVGGTQYVCTGWTLSGNAPMSGGGIGMVLAIINDALLTRNWATNCWLDCAAWQHGTVDVTSGWFGAEAEVVITADTAAGEGPWFYRTKLE